MVTLGSKCYIYFNGCWKFFKIPAFSSHLTSKMSKNYFQLKVKQCVSSSSSTFIFHVLGLLIPNVCGCGRVCVLRWVTRNTEGGVLPVGKWWWICGPPHLRIIAPSSSSGSAVHCQILIFSYSNFIVLRVSIGDFPLCSFLGKWSNWDICPPTPQWGFFLSSSTESHLPFTALLWRRVSFQWAAFWIKVLRELTLWQSYMVQL